MNTFHVRKTGDVILLHLGKGDDMLQKSGRFQIRYS